MANWLEEQINSVAHCPTCGRLTDKSNIRPTEPTSSTPSSPGGQEMEKAREIAAIVRKHIHVDHAITEIAALLSALRDEVRREERERLARYVEDATPAFTRKTLAAALRSGQGGR